MGILDRLLRRRPAPLLPSPPRVRAAPPVAPAPVPVTSSAPLVAPEPVSQVPAAPEPVSQVPAAPEPVSQVLAAPEPVSQVPAAPEPLRQVPVAVGAPEAGIAVATDPDAAPDPAVGRRSSSATPQVRTTTSRASSAEPSGSTATPTARAAVSPTGPTNAELRAWARENGFTVSDRGRVPREVVDAHRAARGGQLQG